jgi:quercetin dioxygenase-like cupin family protein
LRRVDYSPGYRADHWCHVGHVLFVLDGELKTTLEDGRTVILKAGMSYNVGTGKEGHRSSSAKGAQLFIVDSVQGNVFAPTRT